MQSVVIVSWATCSRTLCCSKDPGLVPDLEAGQDVGAGSPTSQHES